VQKVLRQEKQVLHTPREQVKQKGFPAGSVKIFINGLIGKFFPTPFTVPSPGRTVRPARAVLLLLASF